MQLACRVPVEASRAKARNPEDANGPRTSHEGPRHIGAWPSEALRSKNLPARFVESVRRIAVSSLSGRRWVHSAWARHARTTTLHVDRSRRGACRNEGGEVGTSRRADIGFEGCKDWRFGSTRWSGLRRFRASRRGHSDGKGPDDRERSEAQESRRTTARRSELRWLFLRRNVHGAKGDRRSRRCRCYRD